MPKTKVKLRRKGWIVTPEDESLIPRLSRALCFQVETFGGVYWVKFMTKTGFRMGLIDYLEYACPDLEFELDRDFSLPVLTSDEAEALALREYQTDAVNSLLTKGRGIIESPTASGKTRIMAALASKMPKPLLIAVPSRDLLRQTYNELSKCEALKGLRITRYGDIYKEKFGDIGIIVNASLAKLNPPVRKFAYEQVKSLIVDEVHHASGKLYRVLGRCPAMNRAGLSATPTSTDWNEASALRIVSNFGPEVYSGKKDERVQEHVMHPLVFITRPPGENKENQHEVMKALVSRDYMSLKRYDVVRNTDRNRYLLKIAEACRLSGMNVYITVEWVEHVEELKKIAPGVTKHIHFLTGQDSGEERADVYGLISMETEPIIICGTVGGEGVNIRYLNVVIFGSIGKSYVKVVQSVGRAVRKAENKFYCFIVDIQDSLMPKQYKKRAKLYGELGYEILPLADLFKKLKEIRETAQPSPAKTRKKSDTS